LYFRDKQGFQSLREVRPQSVNLDIEIDNGGTEEQIEDAPKCSLFKTFRFVFHRRVLFRLLHRQSDYYI